MTKTLSRILWGIILIAIGVLLGLHHLDLLPFDLFFDGWWSLFIIVPSVMGLITDKNKWGAFIGLLFGVFFLLSAQNVLHIQLLWKLILPVVIVLIGLKMLWGNREKKHGPYVSSRCVAVFAGQELRCDGQQFRDMDVTAVFGGVEVFAANAIITKDCTLNIAAVFGGVEVYLPANVNVIVASHGIFGAVENLRQLPPVEGLPTVTINAEAVFGGVDIQ